MFAKRGYEATSMEEIAERAERLEADRLRALRRQGGALRRHRRPRDRAHRRAASPRPSRRLSRASGSSRRRWPSSPTCRSGPTASRSCSRDTPESQRAAMSALMNDLADRVGDIFAEQFRKAGYDAEGRAHLRACARRHGRVRRAVVDGQQEAAARPRWWRRTSAPSRGWGSATCRACPRCSSLRGGTHDVARGGPARTLHRLHDRGQRAGAAPDPRHRGQLRDVGAR